MFKSRYGRTEISINRKKGSNVAKSKNTTGTLTQEEKDSKIQKRFKGERKNRKRKSVKSLLNNLDINSLDEEELEILEDADDETA